MRLTDLEPQFMRYETRQDAERGHPVEYTIPVPSLSEAQGLWLLCPKCFLANSGPVGTHMIDVTFRDKGAADSQGSHGRDGRPTRWQVTGDDFSNLTTQPSILLEGGCAWHGFITNGEVA